MFIIGLMICWLVIKALFIPAIIIAVIYGIIVLIKNNKQRNY